MTAGQSDEPGKMKFDHLINKARKLWESSPQPVKIFPWKRAVQNFIQLIFDLILAVVKYLSVPLLAVSSLSEMSYCAHAKKLFLVPIPVLIGMAIAEVLKLAALDASPLLKVNYFAQTPYLWQKDLNKYRVGGGFLQESGSSLFAIILLKMSL